MIASKQEFNDLLERLRTLNFNQKLGRHLQSKLEAFEEVEKLINLSIYGVVFNEANLVSSDSINDAPEPLWKSHDLAVEDSEVELCECKKHSIKTNYGFEICTVCGNEWDD